MDCTIGYTPKFVEQAEEIFERLVEALPLRLYEITIFGNRIMQPRRVCWHGPGDYTYSGLTLQPEPWCDDLLNLRDKLSEHFQVDFNSVLANYYRDGNDSVGWHADDETYFGADPIIATLSFGVPRLFCMKRKQGGGKTERFILENGSLFLMGAGVQQNWLHSVPKTKVPVGPRLSLTYRVWNDPSK